MNDHDVYSYGVISASSLYLLKDNFPARTGYAEIAEKYRNIGGEAANTSIVLSRLGLTVKLDGNWINPDDDADFLQDVFSKNNVDISRISFRRCQGPKEMLVVDSDSRTIFGTYAQLLEEKSWNLPERIDVQNAKVICLDPFFGNASLQAANYAKGFSKPIITVDCKYDDPIFLASDIAIISEEYIGHTYPQHSISSVTHEYKASSSGTVIFTFGHKEIIFGSRDEGFKRFTPYDINPVDTAGAGDSFRAGIIFGLLRKWPTGKTIEFASALAAIVCQSFPGVLNSPSYDEVVSFLKDRKSTTFQAEK
jgi:sugar/nucleoside kinase (ribokinase family)